MRPLSTHEFPKAEPGKRPTPMTLEDLRKLKPITQAVILGGAIARRKEMDAKANLGTPLARETNNRSENTKP